MRHCKRRECIATVKRVHVCIEKAAQLNKKPVKNYNCMSDISCLHHGDRLKAVVHGFHRIFIVNSLLVLYLQKSERALLPSMFTRMEFDLSFQCRRKCGHCSRYRNYTAEMEYISITLI